MQTFLTTKQSEVMLSTILRFIKRSDVLKFRSMYSSYKEFVSNMLDTSYTMMDTLYTMMDTSYTVMDTSYQNMMENSL